MHNTRNSTASTWACQCFATTWNKAGQGPAGQLGKIIKKYCKRAKIASSPWICGLKTFGRLSAHKQNPNSLHGWRIGWNLKTTACARLVRSTSVEYPTSRAIVQNCVINSWRPCRQEYGHGLNKQMPVCNYGGCHHAVHALLPPGVALVQSEVVLGQLQVQLEEPLNPLLWVDWQCTAVQTMMKGLSVSCHLLAVKGTVLLMIA